MIAPHSVQRIQQLSADEQPSHRRLAKRTAMSPVAVAAAARSGEGADESPDEASGRAGGIVIGLDLKPQHQALYEEVRRRRRQARRLAIIPFRYLCDRETAEE